MVEVEVAHGHRVDALRGEPGGCQRRHDPEALVAAHRTGLVVDPVADAGLDEHATRLRLDQEAVEGLEEAPLVVDLLVDEAVPQDPRHGPEQRPRVGPERACLDQGDPDAAAEVDRPVDRIVDGHPGYFRVGSPVARPASKSRWKADAVGSDWPWYFDPSSGEPYGRSTGLDIWKKLIWPIRIP